jgi:hypothetical protein
MRKCGLLDTLRGPKLWNMSIFDWVASLLGAWLVGRWLGFKGMAWLGFLLAWTAFGVVVHLAVGVPTELGYKLGLNGPPERTPCV